MREAAKDKDSTRFPDDIEEDGVIEEINFFTFVP